MKIFQTTRSFLPLLLLLLASSATLAQAVQLSNLEKRLAVQEDPDFRADLKHEIENRIRTFERPVKVYHYGNRGPMKYQDLATPFASPSHLKINQDEAMELKRGSTGTLSDYRSPVELQPNETTEYFRAMSSLFRNGKPEWQVGPGLYAAVDPVQSESYMGNPWFMLEIEIPKGMRYLDLRPSDGIVVSKAFVQKWIYGPDAQAFSSHHDLSRIGQNRFILEFSEIVERPVIRAMLQSVLDELQVDLTAYAWSQHTIPPCRELSFDQRIAFNFINPGALGRGLRLNVFVENLEAEASKEKRAEYGRVLNLIESSDMSLWTSSPDHLYAFDNGRTASARLMTMQWSRTLGRESLFADLFPAPGVLDKIYSLFFDDKPPLPVSSANPYVDKTLRVPYNEKYVRAPLPSELGNGSSTPSVSLARYPLKELKSTNPKAFNERMGLIQNTIFGCNPQYPQEDVPPEI